MNSHFTPSRIRLILGILTSLSLLLMFQNCSPAKFSQEAGSNEKASEAPLQVRSFFTAMEGYKPDNWQLTVANWDPMIEVSSPIENATYRVSLRKSRLDRSTATWSGCDLQDASSQTMDEGFQGLQLSNCVIPVEKVRLDVSVLNAQKQIVATETREISVNQLRLHGVSRNLSVANTALDLWETRKPTFKIEYPDWDGFLRIIVKTSSGDEVCRRTFETKLGYGQAHYPDAIRTALQDGSVAREFAFARRDTDQQVVECRLVAGNYIVETSFGMDEEFSQLGSTKNFNLRVRKPVEAVSHIFDEATQTWIAAGQISDNVSYYSLPTVTLKRTGSATSSYACTTKFRIRRSALNGLSGGRILDYSNSNRYHWEVAYSHQITPYDDPDYLYFQKTISACATGPFFIQARYDGGNNVDNSVVFNEFWVRYR